MVYESTPIFERIRRQYGRLSNAKRKVARFLLEHWDEAAFLPAAKIGDGAGVSETVVIRLASDLGYLGYPQMQRELQKMALAVLQSTMVKRLDSTPVPGDHKTLFATSRDRIIKNVNRVFQQNSDSVIMDAATCLMNARNRYVIGLRACFGPAACLGLNLNQMLGRTRVVTLGAGDSYDHLRSVTGDDVAVGITLYRYSRFTYDLLKIVKDRGGEVIAITDDLLAPVSGISDHILTIDSKGFSYGHSHVGTMALIDVLLETIIFLDKQRVRNNLAETEEVLALYGAPECGPRLSYNKQGGG